MSKRQLITEADVHAASRGGESVMRIATNAIITPLAFDAAQAVGVRFEFIQPESIAGKEVTVALGISRAGFPVKRAILDALKARNIPFQDIRDTANDPVQLSVDVVKAVVGEKATFGIILDDTGMLSCMIANRFSGVRAVNAGEARHAQIARSKYDANIITLGSEFLSAARAAEIIGKFLDTQASSSK